MMWNLGIRIKLKNVRLAWKINKKIRNELKKILFKKAMDF